MILCQTAGSDNFHVKILPFFVEIETRVSVVQDGGARIDRGRPSTAASAASLEKFAPRFDGLRFIETLITAHR